MKVYLCKTRPEKSPKVHLDVDCPYLTQSAIPVIVSTLKGLDICELCEKPEDLAAKRTAWRANG